MSAFEVTLNPTFKRSRKNPELSVTEPPKKLFRVVVNNYKQDKRPLQQEGQIPETEDKGLPPQPKGYLKYPAYDWF
jgi:hypothetical protein